MASQFDESDFIDRDFQSSESAHSGKPGCEDARSRAGPPTREELDSRVGEAQRKLAELRRAQEKLERERATLEEARRRRLELQTGREEMLQSLTRGVALLEQAEFAARRDAEQMAKTLTGLREALSGVQSIREETWTQENWNTELTKALASIENGRMEWNQARLKWALLNGSTPEAAAKHETAPVAVPWRELSFWEWCQLGAALTWPIALVGLAGLTLWLILGAR
jgi:DNA repair exonuclease SbcCD ATPase subunit